MNSHRTISLRHRRFADLARITDTESFHRYLLTEAVDRYRLLQQSRGAELGAVMAIGASSNEGQILAGYPFDQVVLSGITPPDSALGELIAAHDRLTYRYENGESVQLPSRSFDLVICKETLHHFARPVAGLYEALRLCRSATILIEPYDSLLGRLLLRLRIASEFEADDSNNVDPRGNYVFRWDMRQLQALLSSYYLDSGYRLDMSVGWMTWKLTAHRSSPVRAASTAAGWLASLLPGAEGNYMSALIVPGDSIPSDCPSCHVDGLESVEQG